MKKLLVLTFVAICILSTSCVTESYLLSSDTTGNEIYFQNGNNYQSTSTDSLKITAAGLKANDDNNSVLLGIENKQDTSYSFKDEQISIYGGNKDTGNWSLIGTWNANAFFADKIQEGNAAKRTANVLGTLAVIDSIIAPYNTVTVEERGRTVTKRYYDPSKVFFTALLADAISDEVDAAVSKDLDSIKRKTLFSNTIDAGQGYSGQIFFSTDRINPDYKVIFTDFDQEKEFVFTRSDREEILHPWTCNRNRELYAFTCCFDCLNGRAGFDMLWLSPERWGGYWGFYSNEQELGSWPLGLTCKLSSHSWLLAGFEFGTFMNDDKSGDKWILAPQVGLNLSFNWADALIRVGYDIPSNKFMLTSGIGISF